jgi:hypothetical protein
MEKFLIATGIIFWTIIVGISLSLIVMFLWDKAISPALSALSNLKFFFFGSRKLKGKYEETWWKYYAHRPGIRDHWKSWNTLRRLAYIKFLKEVRKEIESSLA